MTVAGTIDALRHLYHDFPSKDPSVRLVMLLTVFVAAPAVDHSPRVLHSKLEALKLTPVSKRDIFNVLLNPFIERHKALLNYAQTYAGLEVREHQDFLKELVTKCLEIPSKVCRFPAVCRSRQIVCCPGFSVYI